MRLFRDAPIVKNTPARVRECVFSTPAHHRKPSRESSRSKTNNQWPGKLKMMTEGGKKVSQPKLTLASRELSACWPCNGYRCRPGWRQAHRRDGAFVNRLGGRYSALERRR